MTREDAIDIIRRECYVFNQLNFDRSTMVNTALDMAVKALKQEPSDDCISREAAIKAFGDVHPMDYNTQAYITNIQNLPSVIPEKAPCEDVISRDDALDACDQSINIFDATDRIKELPSVKPKVKECEDCVSREAVHNLIIPWLNDYLFDETREALETIDYKIEDLPSVTPQPKIGHWKKVNTAREYNSDAYECSECKYIIWTYKDADRKWNYCPKCGAKMEEEQDAH